MTRAVTFIHLSQMSRQRRPWCQAQPSLTSDIHRLLPAKRYRLGQHDDDTQHLSDPATYYSFPTRNVAPGCHFRVSTAGSLRLDLSAPRKEGDCGQCLKDGPWPRSRGDHRPASFLTRPPWRTSHRCPVPTPGRWPGPGAASSATPTTPLTASPRPRSRPSRLPRSSNRCAQATPRADRSCTVLTGWTGFRPRRSSFQTTRATRAALLADPSAAARVRVCRPTASRAVPSPSSPCSRRARLRGWLARTVVPSAPAAGQEQPAPNAGSAGGADAAHGRTWNGGPASIPGP